jgi:hypothetical protein
LEKNDENPEAQFQCTPSWFSFQSIPLTTTGSQVNAWPDVNTVLKLKLFGKRTSSARKGYYALQSQGYDFQSVLRRVGGIFGLKAEKVLSPGKQPRRVEARSVACFWAVRVLGMTTVEVSRRLGITQSAVTKAVYRGEKLAKDRGFQMISAA